MRAHMAALAAMVRGDLDAADSVLSETAGARDEFAAFLAHHQLLAFTGYMLEAGSGNLELSDSLLAAIATHQQKLSAKNVRLGEALETLNERLCEQGIPYLLLKGLHLALRFYGGVERRTFWDLDILVRCEDLAVAHRTLTDLGYQRISTRFISEGLSRHFGHAYDYRRQGGLDIDVHWKLANHPGLRFDIDQVWNSRQMLQYGSTPFYALSDQVALGFLLVGILKDIERGALRMRAWVDLYLTIGKIEAETDWEVFFTRRQAEGTRTMCAMVLMMLLRLFRPPPDQWPALHQALAREKVQLPDDDLLYSLLEPARLALQNKAWAAKQYDLSRPAYAAWWAWSLPARLVIHGSASRQRKKSRKARRR